MHILGIIWNPNETLFSLGGLQIKYYNLLWIIAFALGWYLMKKIFLSEEKNLRAIRFPFHSCGLIYYAWR